MLQSAFFSDIQANIIESRFKAPRIRILAAIEKGSYARLMAWGRSLLGRSEIDSLNDHLLRDIGLI